MSADRGFMAFIGVPPDDCVRPIVPRQPLRRLYFDPPVKVRPVQDCDILSSAPLPISALIAPVTPLQQNCTVVWCAATRKAAVIDPGGEVDHLLQILEQEGLQLEKIWVTHG